MLADITVPFLRPRLWPAAFGTLATDREADQNGRQQMRKGGNSSTLVILIFGTLLVLNCIDNPRIAALHGPDIIRLIAIGLSLGVAFGIQCGARVFGKKTTQP